MKTSDFDYTLPSELIAQIPLDKRDTSRLMVINRQNGGLQHNCFKDIVKFLRSGDVLVVNNSRVIPARLFGRKENTGAKVEILLLRRTKDNRSWEVLAKPGKVLPVGTRVVLESSNSESVVAEITGILDEGVRVVTFDNEEHLGDIGHTPLPPYIQQQLSNSERYQTVYASSHGSVAAPTAGLHFTMELLSELSLMGVETLEVTLHIGLDTFRPVMVDNPAEHHIHSEYGVITQEVATKINTAKREGRRIVCVGTTSVRLLEYVANKAADVLVQPYSGWVDLLILPGFTFKVTDMMLTNFHLPKSTLLMMVSAFAGNKLIREAYAEAIKQSYRFYSFGDAMLIL